MNFDIGCGRLLQVCTTQDSLEENRFDCLALYRGAGHLGSLRPLDCTWHSAADLTIQPVGQRRAELRTRDGSGSKPAPNW